MSALTRADRLLDRRNHANGGCILAFHQIEVGQLERLVAHHVGRYEIVSLDAMLARHRAGRSTAGLMALTFDDGYRTTVLDAVSLAHRRGWPMTFYLPTDAIDSDTVYWFVELRVLLENLHLATPLQVDVLGAPFTVGCTIEARRAAVDALEAHLFYRSPAELATGIGQLRAAVAAADRSEAAPITDVDDGPYQATDAATIGWSDVERLATDDLITFGAHTASHPFLSTLADAAVEHELVASQRLIEEHWNRPVRHFCYPYGDARSIGDVAPAVAARHFDSAVTMTRGRCAVSADPFLLPRIPIYEQDAPSVSGLKVSMAA